MTRLRTLLFCGLSAGLGSVATGGLRMMDSRIGLVGAVGSATLLAVALVVDAIKRAGDGGLADQVAALRLELASLQQEVAAIRDHLTILEGAIAVMKTSADVALRRTDPGWQGAADRSGPNAAIKP